MRSERLFSSKILLFGEHSLIKGSKGLLIPYPKYSGVLEKNIGAGFDKIQNLISFFERSPVIKKNLNIEKLKIDSLNGLSFNSTIPQGQGLGSSGALTAALLWEYGIDLPKKDFYEEEDLALLKDILSLMESFYHGTSSGMDPLVSYVGRPVYIEAKNKIREIHLPESDEFKYFLISTHKRREASGLVYYFLNKCDREEISKEDLEVLINSVDGCVEASIKGDGESLFKSFNQLSKFQFLHLKDLIPESLHNLWFQGLEQKDFFLKLCGAGGGGHYLGMAKKDADLSFIKDIIYI